MSASEGLLILGFGGHARSVADVALAAGFRSLLFIDENARPGEQFLGFPVQRNFSESLPPGWLCMPAAGDNQRRKLQMELACVHGLPLATLISPTATVGAGAVVSSGALVAHHAHVGPLAHIGTGSIINTGAIVEHDCVIGEYAHVSVNATVAGRGEIGSCVFLGAGATVIDGICIASDVVIGAGGVVTSSITQPGTYVGIPVKSIGTPRH